MSKSRSNYTFLDGIRDSVPIGLGYLSVSFGFGISAIQGGIKTLVALIISMTNLTSAGQVAGIAVIISGGTLVEMALTQLTINLRYSLMSISLSQRLESGIGTLSRAAIGFGVTDEIFAVAVSKPHHVGKAYMAGLISLPYVAWATGTLLGAVCGNILPEDMKNALGIAIYGMFIAIVVPDMKKSLGVIVAAITSAAVSCGLRYIPIFSGVSAGFSIIICAVIGAVTASLIFPHKTEESN